MTNLAPEEVYLTPEEVASRLKGKASRSRTGGTRASVLRTSSSAGSCIRKLRSSAGSRPVCACPSSPTAPSRDPRQRKGALPWQESARPF